LCSFAHTRKTLAAFSGVSCRKPPVL